MTDTFIDGCGVIKDQPLPEGTRLRLRPVPGRDDLDISVYVEDGRVHLAGQYARLVAWSTEPNRVEVMSTIAEVGHAEA